MSKQQTLLYWVLRIVAAVILLQTLFFKFTASEESVFIFSSIGMEPWGRIGTGVMELIAAVLLIIPRTIAIGALLAMGLMSGALFFHFTILGIEVKGDGGLLFVYALIVFVFSAILLFVYQSQIRQLIQQLQTRKS